MSGGSNVNSLNSVNSVNIVNSAQPVYSTVLPASGIFHTSTHLQCCDIVVVKVFRCRQPTWSVFVPSVGMLDEKKMNQLMKNIHIKSISQIHQDKKDKFGNLKGLNLAESCIPTQHQARREVVLNTSVT